MLTTLSPSIRLVVVLQPWLSSSGGITSVVGYVMMAVGVATLALGVVWPRAVLPEYVILNAIALPIGLVVSTVILLLIYYVVLTPLGLVLRLCGHDSMKKRLEPERESYWTERRPPDSVKRYFRQY